jgi:pimeloyl-ACP methyl ester carboxylesterase
MISSRERQALASSRGRRPNLAGAPALTCHRGGTGPPLVLVHGLGLTWRSWQPVLDALETRHDVVAIDLPGFGESPPLPDGDAPTPTRLADAVESELDRLNLDAPALVGNSLGGWVMLELARRGRAGRAVVISPSGLESPPERSLVIALNELMLLRARLGAPLGRWLIAPALARVMVFAGLRSQPWRLSPDAATHDLHDFGYSPGFQSTLASTVATRAPLWLGKIEVPVRVAYGRSTSCLASSPLRASRRRSRAPSSSRCQQLGTSPCSTIPNSSPKRSSISPLTLGHHHGEPPFGRDVRRLGTTMGQPEPHTTTNLATLYDQEVMPWSRATTALGTGSLGPEPACFLGTTRPDGRPRSAGEGVVVVDDSLFFTTGPAARSLQRSERGAGGVAPLPIPHPHGLRRRSAPATRRKPLGLLGTADRSPDLFSASWPRWGRCSGREHALSRRMLEDAGEQPA